MNAYERPLRLPYRVEGLRVPLDDVPAHLACGWRLAELFPEIPSPDGRELLVPPACFREVAV